MHTAVLVFFMSIERHPVAGIKSRKYIRDENVVEGEQFSPVVNADLLSHEVNLPLSLLNLMMGSADFVFMVDSEFNYISVNKAYCQSLGYGQQEMLCMSMPEIDVINDLTAWKKIFKKLRTTGSIRMETMQRNRDGETFPIEMTVNYLMHKGREYSLGLGRDISGRKQMEESLKENEDKCRRLIESSGAGVLVINISGYITYANRALCNMTGYSREKLSGKYFADYILENDRPAVLDVFNKGLTADCTGAMLEFRVVHSNGSIVWCSSSPSRIVHNGIVTGYNSLIQDITGRKNLEEALRESERKYRAVVEDQLEMICRFIPDGTITFANSAFCRFYGKTSSDIVGKSYLSLIPEDQYPFFTAAIEELLAEPHRVIYDIQHYSRGGVSRWMEQTFRALAGENNQVEKFQVVFRDITDRKRAEQALKDSEEQFRMIFDSIQDGFAVFEVNYDEKGKVIDARFLEVNPAFEKITGAKANDVLGKTLWEVFPSMRLLTADRWKELISEGKNIKIEELYARSLDKYFRINGLSPKHGRYAILVCDLTEHRKMTEKLMRTDRLSSLGEMAAGLAHEINNPLTGVIGLSQLLLERPDVADNVKADVEGINKEANRAAGILRDFMIFARGRKPVMQAADINAVIDEVIKLRYTYMKKSGIEVYTDFSQELPELMMDISQIQQVLLNIILNAEYFMTEAHQRGLLKIMTSLHGSTVRTVFEDDGPGIREDTLPHIFDPFFTTKEASKGTGLGLSISYGIIREHNGNIFAETMPGLGARFIIELPASI